jgi:hypothetical protein
MSRASDQPSRVDFGTLGGDVAYRGTLRTSWGAALVEPSAVAQINAQAGGKLARLGDIAPARSGIATRVVAYFMVEELTDPALLAQHGLTSRTDRDRLALVRDGRGVEHLIERGALMPMVRRPSRG